MTRLPVQYGPTLLSWASQIDPGALEQVGRLARMPFIYPHVAVMPDVHVGRGAPIGAVTPTRKAIMPAIVGTDIGTQLVNVKGTG